MEDIRRAILDHAVELVAEHGVRGVSFREVARRAGVSHQAPYHHFGNLQGILEAIAREGFATLTRSMQKAARHEDPIEAYRGIGLAYVRFATSNVGYFRVMFQRSLVDLHDQASPIEEAAATYQTLVDCTTRLIEAGYASSLEPDGFAHLSWSTVHGLATLIVEGALQKKSKREVTSETKLVVDSLTRIVTISRSDEANAQDHGNAF